VRRTNHPIPAQGPNVRFWAPSSFIYSVGRLLCRRSRSSTSEKAGRLTSRLERIVGSRELAEDLGQEAFILVEAVMLAVLGGAVGVVAGVAATVVYASTRGWSAVIPPEAWVGGKSLPRSRSRPSQAWPRRSARPACRRPRPCARSDGGLDAAGLDPPGAPDGTGVTFGLLS
jgi:hypothetical protein